MPTIEGIDSFQHRIIPTAFNATTGWYSAVNNGGTTPNHGGGGLSFDTSIKRTADHACSLKIVTDGVSATNLKRNIGSKTVVGSFYFYTTAAGSGTNKLVCLNLSSGTQSISMDSTGHIQSKVGSGTAQTSSGTYADSAWHRIDFKADTTGATALLDVQVDGTDVLTQATLALATANMTGIICGDNTVATAQTIYLQDLCWGTTSGDYPLGDHICLGSTINGTGTHSKGAGTWTDQAGSTADADLLAAVDDAWNGTTPELSQTGEDHVKKTADINGNDYLEFTIEDASSATSAVWGAHPGALIAALDSTTANAQSFRLYDSGGNVLANPGAIDASISSTAYSAYRVYSTAAPAGGWASGFNGCVVRWGYSTDVTPNPVMNAMYVEYVGAWSAPAGSTWAGVHTTDRSIYTAI